MQFGETSIFNPLFILFVVFASALFLQLIYFWFIYSRLAFYKQKQTEGKKRPVSIIICAKNEYLNLHANLPIILDQDYPEFEVIVVNDSSDDETDILLDEMAKLFPRLKAVHINQSLNFFHGKKFPLSIGIKEARYEYLLLTDADCRPKSDQWLNRMQAGFSQDKEIVLGYGAYARVPGFLNKLIRFEAFLIAVQYLSFSLCKLTYMGVGRNLAYTKTLFHRNNGFISHLNIPSGDDDLFINTAATSKNTTLCIDELSHTQSVAKNTFSLWFRQKRRHLTTARYYRFLHQFLLGMYAFTQIIFFISFILLLSYRYVIFISLGMFALRLITQLIIWTKISGKLGEKDLLVFSPIFEVVLLVINIFTGAANLFLPQQRWK